MPLYASIDRGRLRRCARWRTCTQPAAGIGAQRFVFSVLRGQLPGGSAGRTSSTVRRCSRATPSTPTMPTSTCASSPSRAQRHRMLPDALGARRSCTATTGTPPSRPLFLRTALYSWDRCSPTPARVLTIHNIGYQGVFGAARARRPGRWRRHTRYLLHQETWRAGRINALRTAPVCGRHHHRQPDLRAPRSARPSTAWAWRRSCATRRHGLGRHPERRRLRGVGPARRPLPARALRRRSACRSRRRSSRQLPGRAWAWMPDPGGSAGRRRHPPRDAEGHRTHATRRCRSCWRSASWCFVVLGAGEAALRAVAARAGARACPAACTSTGLQRGARALDRGGQRHVPHALALRAVRPEPDVQPALRHGADRAPHRRPRRLGAALRSRPRAPAPAWSSTPSTGRRWSGR